LAKVKLRMTNKYYAELDAQLRDEGRLDLRFKEPPIVLVVTDTWNRLTDRAVQFALQLSPDVMAVHLTKFGGPDVQEQRRRLRQQWFDDVEAPAKKVGLRPPRLVLLDAPFRRIEGPLLQFISETARKTPFRQVAVLIPEVVKEHWWQYLRARPRCSAFAHCAAAIQRLARGRGQHPLVFGGAPYRRGLGAGRNPQQQQRNASGRVSLRRRTRAAISTR
jgi:hypothetical protein